MSPPNNKGLVSANNCILFSVSNDVMMRNYSRYPITICSS